MELTPAMKLGWLNGWIMLGSFYLLFGVLMLVFPKDVVKRLFDVSGWSRKQRILSVLGKPFALACVGLIILTPLKTGRAVFAIGGVLFGFGFIGMMVALFNFSSAPVGQPVTSGLYRVSRNPQWITLAMMFLGVCIAIGSWAALILFIVSTAFYHFRILGEENACLKRYGESYKAYMSQVPRHFLFF